MIKTFENNLMKLDPEKDEFVLQVNGLVDAVEVEFHEELIPSIFKFFEAHPLSDCGAPGSLVHLTETYYPSYMDMLIESISKQPSYNSILMVNRILNSEFNGTSLSTRRK